jgi:tRNA threonylcarbamoyl adenosine modification protein (Sua5/YciO/YrdC/YwlC family)
MLLHLHPLNPQPRNIRTIVECLLDGGVIVYPTDTIYGLGCDIFQSKAIERICRIKKVDPAKAQLSFICHDLSDLSNYTKSISTPLYRLLKTYLPGPYTFILPASKQVPKILKSRKDTIGLRIPDNVIARSLIKELGHPILSSSLPGGVGGVPAGVGGHSQPEALRVEEYTDPEMIDEKFSNLVDIVVDGGIGGILPSTVIDCTGDEPVVIRRGLGPWEEIPQD